LLYADLEAAIVPGLAGVVLPMVSSVEQVREADGIVDAFERQRGLPGIVELHLALETAEGNLHAPEIIAASARVRSVSLGRADLVMDLRPEPNGELHMMPYLLQRLVTVARASGVEPIGAWWDADSRGMLASPEATLRAARRARRHGFRGGMGVRASQVDPLNAGFTPDVAEVARAEVLVQAFETARARGEQWGVEQGQIVDAARAETARRVIAHAELCRGRDQRKQSAAVAAGHE
jgi:citrate lyase subunit beta / citryl-CoA lyase